MKTMRIKLIVYSTILACVFAGCLFCVITPVEACESATLQSSSVKHVQMLRLYNSYTGEHFYTSSANEKANLVKVGWTYEGEGWVAPVNSKSPVYRLYNKYAGDHHYTLNAKERDNLVKVGWTDEGIGWYSDDNKEVALLRQYNPNAKVGTHNFTTSTNENANLVRSGWSAEGVSWYGVAGNSHSWTLKTETIHHDAVTKQEENWVMETHHVCGICGKISDPSKGEKIIIDGQYIIDPDDEWMEDAKKHVRAGEHWYSFVRTEPTLRGYKTVTVTPEYDEQITGYICSCEI